MHCLSNKFCSVLFCSVSLIFRANVYLSLTLTSEWRRDVLEEFLLTILGFSCVTCKKSSASQFNISLRLFQPLVACCKPPKYLTCQLLSRNSIQRVRCAYYRPLAASVKGRLVGLWTCVCCAPTTKWRSFQLVLHQLERGQHLSVGRTNCHNSRCYAYDMYGVLEFDTM